LGDGLIFQGWASCSKGRGGGKAIFSRVQDGEKLGNYRGAGKRLRSVVLVQRGTTAG